MVRQCVFTLSTVAAILMATTAGAIVPGAQQIGVCGNFTAGKYQVSSGDVTVKPSRQTPLGFYLDWSVRSTRSAGYCFVTNRNLTTRWVVEKGPRPEQVAVRPPVLGPNERLFTALPGYGDVVINRGQGATGDKQYFLVRPVRTGQNSKWYARCGNNSDQVYDASGRYVGSDRRMTVMFPYVCEVSPLSPKPQPQIQPPMMTPQPR
ncbi:MAG: hypothetical protein DCF22_25070 [Leptolyngbya sp.]|nr:MAG: hypothetical protein DCF22_25070 [Leptolyngbya sp.]